LRVSINPSVSIHSPISPFTHCSILCFISRLPGSIAQSWMPAAPITQAAPYTGQSAAWILAKPYPDMAFSVPWSCCPTFG
jgi:hypothetical protein